MPKLLLPINDIYETVERPVLVSIVKQLIDITQVSHRTTIRFSDAEQRDQQRGSAFDDIGRSSNSWPYDEKIIIEVDEQTNKERLLSTTIHQNNEIPIFLDEDLKIVVKPVYQNFKVNVSFRYRASDKNQALKWRNEFRLRASMMRELYLHEASYHYHLREEIVDCIYHLHGLREKVAGYGDTFEKYFAEHLIDRASIKTDQSGKVALWGIDERQVRIQGYFDAEGEPEKGDRESGSDAWSISVNYVFSYDKPLHLAMSYPLVIHNQLVDEKYRSNYGTYDINAQPLQYNLHNHTLSAFQSDKISSAARISNGVSIPEYDEFIPGNILSSSVRLFTALCVFEPDNKRALFNLKDLGDYHIDPIILDFIEKSEYPYLQKDYESIFNLSFYRDSARLRDDHIEVLPDLSIQTNYDINLRQTYRVRLSLITDLTYLSTGALVRLQNYQRSYLMGPCEINAILNFDGVVQPCLAAKLRYYVKLGIVASMPVESFIHSGDISEFCAYLLTVFTGILTLRFIDRHTIDEVRVLHKTRKFSLKAINQLRDLNQHVPDINPHIARMIQSKDCRELTLQLLQIVVYRNSLSEKIIEYINEALRLLGGHPDIKSNRIRPEDAKVIRADYEAEYGRNERIRLYQFQSIVARNSDSYVQEN